MRLVLVVLCMPAWSASAQTPLTAEEFDALTLGRTMTWSEFGTVYGVEQYLPDRRVRWRVLGGDCKTGSWYMQGADICFVYEDNPSPFCWAITEADGGLRARAVGDPASAVPVDIAETAEPLACFGPEVGV